MSWFSSPLLSDCWFPFILEGTRLFPGRTWSLRNWDFNFSMHISLTIVYLCVCFTLKVHLPSCYWYLDKFIFSLKLGSFPVFSNPVGGQFQPFSTSNLQNILLTPPSFSHPLYPVAHQALLPLNPNISWKSFIFPSLRTPWVQTIISSLDDFLRMAPQTTVLAPSIFESPTQVVKDSC